jgi:hypothetical protein
MADLLMAGWSYSPQYDWARRRHNNLVAYEELDEATREFDRAVIRQMLPDAGPPAA